MMATLRVVFVFLACVTAAQAGDWPAWRGPEGQGHTSETNLPLKWGPKENVKWSVKLPDAGNSTPVIFGDKIFLTQGNKGGSSRGTLCFQKADGKKLWEQKIDYTDKEKVWNQEYYCSASPAVDGERVVVSYGSAGMYCYDLDGKLQWKRDDLGKWEHQFGNASSPVIYKDLVVLWCGPDPKNTKLIGVNKKTGETVWTHAEKEGSWGTPVIAKVGDRDQLILGVAYKLKGFDPLSGKEIWFCDGLTQLVYTSPLVSKGIAVAMSGYGGSALAVKLGGEGDITKQRLWHHPKNIQRVGSGAIVGDHIYILEETGIPHRYELESGKQVWQVDKKVAGRSWGSMLVSGDRLYVLTQNGDTQVFAANPKFELLATNKLGEGANASIAVSNGELFIRTFRTLWCIKESK